MQFARYRAVDGRVHRVARRGEELVDLTEAPLADSVVELLSLGEAELALARDAAATAPLFDPVGCKLLPPVEPPQKVLCVGLNYADHARETGKEPPDEPLIFSKLHTALCGSGSTIPLPRVSSQVDYEAELVAVIGRQGRNIPREQALAHVAGYTIGCDISARDWQKGKPGGQWLLGKSFDGFAPLGPWLVTADEVPDPHRLDIELRLNGRRMQHSNTREFIFSIEELIAYISQVCTLSPGDLIFTGTPPGVGAARKPPVYLQPGDRVEIEISGLGLLECRFVAES